MCGSKIISTTHETRPLYAASAATDDGVDNRRAAGPVAFVAFLAGPLARALNRGRTTLLGAGLVGALIVVTGDYVAAYAIPDTNLPVGVITGAIGAPFLLWLIGRRTR